MKHLNKTVTILFAGFLTLAMSADALAAGFGVNERSALASGRITAVYGKLLAPSTLFYNPAGMAELDGLQISIGGQFISGTQTYSDPEGERAGTEGSLVKPIPNLAITYRLTDWWTLGTGIMVPHGLAVDWADDFVGKSIVSFVELKAPHVVLGSGFQLMENLSLGVNGYFAFTQLELARDFVGNTVAIESHPLFQNQGDGLGFAGSIGLQYRPLDKLHIGLHYKTKLDLDYKDGRFIMTNPDGDKLVEALTQTEISLPGQLDIAVGYDISDDIYVELDATYTQWSVLQELSLRFSELDGDCGMGCSTTPIKSEEITPLKWEDVWFIRAGVDWQMNDDLLLSSGIGFDATPIPDETLSPLLPGSDRIPVSLGASYKIPSVPLFVDASYMFVYFLPRTVTGIEEPLENATTRFRATYETTAQLFGLNLRYVPGASGTDAEAKK